MTASILHCLEKLHELTHEAEVTLAPVKLFQLGYNLGRLSELTSLGRAACWDPWKPAIENDDREALRKLVRTLAARLGYQASQSSAPD